ncbi:CpsD/CapB family tyrosine-protein kinase [Caloramator sp. mosi_1]|uniref:tyrosine-protein kinase family protein n=1 Tax=Caloramator sp. mosi_1 TaxID=3023090 RepID=UPI002362AEAC|nr:CpsD/CapB family tyrosine-protein kinase [Caloramator sp. mosi_1]WDC84203.1 CpsD/CapB family tyrosine-protein kinase [Caloramator sp. mosi_1]
MFFKFKKTIKKIVVTSSCESEGKSTVTSNLAITLAQRGYKTLILDANMRNPGIQEIFNVYSKQKGLSDILRGECVFSEALIKGPVDNLDLIISGTSTLTPVELIASHSMINFLNTLEDMYEYIIIDTPPVLMVTDAQILSKYADGTLLVVASGQTDKDALKKQRSK